MKETKKSIMNSAIIAVTEQISASPVTSLTISMLVSIWVKIYHSRWDPALYSYSYIDLMTKQQWWKIFTAPFCQTSFLSLLFNVITLWGIRSIEVVHGSWYFFRYSLLLIAVQGLLTTWIIHLIVTYSATQIVLRSMSLSGCSGIILSWIAYQISSQMVMNDSFYLIGFIPIPWDLAPIFIMITSRSKTLFVLNVVGYLTGISLSYGLLQLLPDLYWSVCFIFNIAIFLLISSSIFQAFLVSLNSNTGANVTEQHDGEFNQNEMGQVIGGYEERGSRDQDGNDIEMGGRLIGSGADGERERERGSLTGPVSPTRGYRQGFPQSSSTGDISGRREESKSFNGGDSELSRGRSDRLQSHSRYEHSSREQEGGDGVEEEEEEEEGEFEGTAGGLSHSFLEDLSSRPLLGRGRGGGRGSRR